MVVLVRVVDGALDDVSRDADVGGVKDKAFAVGVADLGRDSAITKRAWIALTAPSVNDVVVSEVRDSMTARLAIVSLSV